ncbi:MAG TPA: non-canonical purine NTP pyrophosphatase [Clostridia bacterium]|nr:non-canonical purine NTP pyrophosphatase [Clostridia bacterium]
MHGLIIATRNGHKLEEIKSIVGGTCVCRGLNDFSAAPAVMEDAPTFAGNATKKAVSLARWLCGEDWLQTGAGSLDQWSVLADDSGLEVDALGGAPGVLSARFAAGNRQANSTDAENNAKLLYLLRDVPEARRGARFRCVMALTPLARIAPANASPVCQTDEFELGTRLFDGACEGRIGFKPGGQGGFGYDPLFIPDGFSESFAELGEAVKNRISHRAKALEKLRQALRA